jgi:tetratricopeptide (TPR) repeat protein
VGYWERWKQGGLERTLLAVVGIHFLFYASFWNWYGGVHYGNRFLLDLFPYTLYLMFPAFRLWKKTLLVLGILAIAIHALGAFAYENAGPHTWDLTPIPVLYQRERLWDWKDFQILRTFQNLRFAQELWGFKTLKERQKRVFREEKESFRLYQYQARLALEQNDFPKAKYFLQLAGQWGVSDEFYFLEAQYWQRQGEREKARESFEKAYWFSQYLPALIQIVALDCSSAHPLRSETLLLGACQRLSLFWQPYFLLGQVYQSAQEPLKAIEFYEKALALKPRNAEIGIPLVRLLLENQQEKKAKILLDQLISPDPLFQQKIQELYKKLQKK